MSVNDATPYIEVKRARIARAGKQLYSAKDFSERTGKVRDSGKAFYVEYRPPEVLLKNRDRFANLPFVNLHTPVDVTPDNWKDYTIGFVGSRVDVEVVDGEVWLTNDVTFFDRKAYEDYKAGRCELSASYDARYAIVKDADKAGYDSVLLDISAVNHIALCDKARAGHNARILDSAAMNFFDTGGLKMKGGFLSFLGLKPKDDAFKFSAVLMDSLGKVKSDPAGVEKEIAGIAGHVAKLGDSEAKEVLAGAVADCYKNVEAVLGAKDDVSRKLDELYGKCQDADTEAVKRILEGTAKIGDAEDEAKKKKEEEEAAAKAKKEKEGGGKTNDSVDEVINAAVEKAFAKVNDSIDTKIDAAVKKALGLDEKAGEKKPAVNAAKLSDSIGDENAEFLVRGVFGMR